MEKATTSYTQLLGEEFEPQDGDFKQRSKKQRRMLWWTVVIMSLLCNVILIFRTFYSRNHEQNIVYSPAQAAGILETRAEYWDVTLGDSSEYTESLGPEVDERWNDITAPPGNVGFIKVQKDEVDAIDDFTVPFADGSGYLVTVDVFHQLHCLDFLRKQLYGTMKSPDDEEGVQMNNHHKAHCIDSLRRYIQCHADTSMLTMKYIEGHSYPWPDFRTTHQCYNWDRVLEWARSRNVNASRQFVHPTFGLSENGPRDNPIAGGKEVKWLPKDTYYP